MAEVRKGNLWGGALLEESHTGSAVMEGRHGVEPHECWERNRHCQGHAGKCGEAGEAAPEELRLGEWRNRRPDLLLGDSVTWQALGGSG